RALKADVTGGPPRWQLVEAVFQGTLDREGSGTPAVHDAEEGPIISGIIPGTRQPVSLTMTPRRRDARHTALSHSWSRSSRRRAAIGYRPWVWSGTARLAMDCATLRART